MEGNTPKEAAENTSADIERLYIRKELFTFVVSGITFKVKDLTADELFEITRKSMVDDEVQQGVYARELMKKCILEPQIDFSREMRGTMMTQILGELENVLGLAELAQKKLKMR